VILGSKFQKFVIICEIRVNPLVAQPKLGGGVYLPVRYISTMKRVVDANADTDGGIRSKVEDRRSPKPRSVLHPRFAILFFLIASSLMPGWASAITTGNSYNGIVDRNVFGLKPPTPPPDPNANKAPEKPSTITLTGITTILGNKRALLKVAIPARPPEPAKDENYMLTEGQRDGNVEVLEINERTGSVKVSNAGEISTLTFDKNGAKLVASAPPVPGAMQSPPPGMGMPGGASGGAAANPGTLRTIPTRTMRTGQAPENNNNSQIGGAPNGNAGNASHLQNFDPAEQTILIEVERERTKADVETGKFPPLPPTQLTPEGSYGMPQPPVAPQ
jgi:hypothetical protein